MTEKISKQAVLYLNKPNTEYECKDCLMWISDTDRCTVHGKEDEVFATDTCGLFVYGHPVTSKDHESSGSVSKKESGFTRNPQKTGYSCKRCEYWVLKEDCKLVDKDSLGDDPGKIKGDACCNAWEYDETKGKLISILTKK